MLIVMPRAFSSGALSIWSYALNSACPAQPRHFGDRSCQRGLAVVDVSHRPNVQMRLAPVKFFLRHNETP
jgi:hypothetical protein